jgi:hypothetical protein
MKNILLVFDEKFEADKNHFCVFLNKNTDYIKFKIDLRLLKGILVKK